MLGVGLVFISLGVYMLWLSRKQLLQAKVIQSWPVVSGEILYSRMITFDREPDRWITFDRDPDRFEFLYEYEFGGTTRRSPRIDFFETQDTDEEKRDCCKKYPAGMHVQVFVHPETGDGVLEPGNFQGYFRQRNLGILSLIFGAVALGFGLKLNI
jgi:Protein of unknown function (DUF3592)